MVKWWEGSDAGYTLKAELANMFFWWTGYTIWQRGKDNWRVSFFQTTQGNRLSCREQEGRRDSEEAGPGPSVFPSREPGVSENFWWSHEGWQDPFRPSGRKRGLPLRRRRGQGPHLAKRWEPRGFSRVAAGISAFPLGWPWDAQSSSRVLSNWTASISWPFLVLLRSMLIILFIVF